MIKGIRKSATKIIFIYIGLTPMLLFLFGPIIWNLSISLRGPKESFTEIPYLIPKQPTLQHYIYAITKLGQFGIFHYMKNSFIVAGITTFISLLVITPAAYALSRFQFRGSNSIQIWILASQMLPSVLLVIPLFIVIKLLGLLNNYFGLVILYTTFAVPFCTWMLKGYFDAIPTDMEECAMVDGCTRLQAFRHVVIPMISPGLAAVSIFAFLLGYEEYLFALCLMKSEKMHTVTVEIATLNSTQYGTLWGPITASAIILMVPVIIIFLFIQRFLVAGLTAGAIKE